MSFRKGDWLLSGPSSHNITHNTVYRAMEDQDAMGLVKVKNDIGEVDGYKAGMFDLLQTPDKCIDLDELSDLYASSDAKHRAMMEERWPCLKPKMVETVEEAMMSGDSQQADISFPVGTWPKVKAYLDLLFVEAAINQGGKGYVPITKAALIERVSFDHWQTYILPFHFASKEAAEHVAQCFAKEIGVLIG